MKENQERNHVTSPAYALSITKDLPARQARARGGNLVEMDMIFIEYQDPWQDDNVVIHPQI